MRPPEWRGWVMWGSLPLGLRSGGTVMVPAPTPTRRFLALLWFTVLLAALTVLVVIFVAVMLLPGASLLAVAISEVRASG